MCVVLKAPALSREEEIPVACLQVRPIAVVPVLLVSIAFLLQPASAGDTLTVVGEITPGVGPVAAFSAYPTSGTAPFTVQFTDASTGTVTAQSWEYRRGEGPWTRFSTKTNPSLTFRTGGTYDIRLTVTGPMGSDEERKDDCITVQEPVRPPVARFAQDRYAGKAPLTVQFEDRSLNSPTSFRWWFGDGGTSQDRTPSHTYRSPGAYVVRLRVSNSAGSDTATSVVVVIPGRWQWAFPS